MAPLSHHLFIVIGSGVIVDCGVTTGTFASVVLTPISSPLRWKCAYHPSDLLLRAILPGDANCDGIVDYRDVAPFAMALVDPADYLASAAPFDVDRVNMIDDGVAIGADISRFLDVLLQ